MVKELGARRKCAGAVTKGSWQVRWSSDERIVMVKELGACGKCAGAVTKGP